MPLGTTWFYVVTNTTAQNVNLAIVTDITITNELGNYLAGVQQFEQLDLWKCASLLPLRVRHKPGVGGRVRHAGADAGVFPAAHDAARDEQSGALQGALDQWRSLAARAYDLQVQKSTANFQGWGLLNLPNSLPVSITNGVTHLGAASMQIFDQSPASALATGQSQTRLVTVNELGRDVPLRVTLVWTDPPGNPTAGVKLVNDLDLIVTNLDTGDVFLGNNIGPSTTFTFPWDTNSAPTADAINNVENVYLAPQLGKQLRDYRAGPACQRQRRHGARE